MYFYIFLFYLFFYSLNTWFVDGRSYSAGCIAVCLRHYNIRTNLILRSTASVPLGPFCESALVYYNTVCWIYVMNGESYKMWRRWLSVGVGGRRGCIRRQRAMDSGVFCLVCTRKNGQIALQTEQRSANKVLAIDQQQCRIINATKKINANGYMDNFIWERINFNF